MTWIIFESMDWSSSSNISAVLPILRRRYDELGRNLMSAGHSSGLVFPRAFHASSPAHEAYRPSSTPDERSACSMLGRSTPSPFSHVCDSRNVSSLHWSTSCTSDSVGRCASYDDVAFRESPPALLSSLGQYRRFWHRDRSQTLWKLIPRAYRSCHRQCFQS